MLLSMLLAAPCGARGAKRSASCERENGRCMDNNPFPPWCAASPVRIRCMPGPLSRYELRLYPPYRSAGRSFAAPVASPATFECRLSAGYAHCFTNASTTLLTADQRILEYLDFVSAAHRSVASLRKLPRMQHAPALLRCRMIQFVPGAEEQCLGVAAANTNTLCMASPPHALAAEPLLLPPPPPAVGGVRWGHATESVRLAFTHQGGH